MTSAGDALCQQSSCEVVATFSSGSSKRLPLRVGTTIRIGRKRNSDIVLDSEGVSALHAELSLVQTEQSVDGGGDGFRLCVRDVSRNGTAVRACAGPAAKESWAAVKKGETCTLGQGWQIKVPMRGRRDGEQMAEDVRTITLFVSVVAAAPVPSTDFASNASMQQAPVKQIESVPQPPGIVAVKEPPADHEDGKTNAPEDSHLAAPVSDAPPPPELTSLTKAVPPVAATAAVTSASMLLNAAVRRRRAPLPAPTRGTTNPSFGSAPAPPPATRAVSESSTFWSPADSAVQITRQRSRSRGGDCFVPRDLSVSPISEPGVGVPRRRKKDKARKATKPQAGITEEGKLVLSARDRRGKTRVLAACGEERPTKKKRSKRDL